MGQAKRREAICQGKAFLGIELGSTRIKAVLMDEEHKTIVFGSQEWENRYEEGVWTYHLEEVWSGLQRCYQKLAKQVETLYQTKLTTVGAIGFSGMMHGYLAFDRQGNLLTPFRTWRNTTTQQAATELTDLFQHNIPQRWSIAHLYQAILSGEKHVPQVDYLTTLAGYVHWKLTGQRVSGVGDASGIFPIDYGTVDYDEEKINIFEQHIAARHYSWKLRNILPRVRFAGQPAGMLTEKGARLLDPTGCLKAGIPLCPPEGDAGTGMVATNAMEPRTGNVSAGTSVFAMIVLERELSQIYPQVDVVTTPTGKPVAMVHCNNCTSEINAWCSLFQELAEMLGVTVKPAELLPALYQSALAGSADGGGLMLYNYHSGESITGFTEGRPLLIRTLNSEFTLANFMRVQIMSALSTLKIGMDTLLKTEHVGLDRLTGHGGLFKTPVVGQRILAAAMGVPVSVLETADEGGAWGMALLAAYQIQKGCHESLEDYLTNRVFSQIPAVEIAPSKEDMAGFHSFLQRYQRGLEVERAAVDYL